MIKINPKLIKGESSYFSFLLCIYFNSNSNRNATLEEFIDKAIKEGYIFKYGDSYKITTEGSSYIEDVFTDSNYEEDNASIEVLANTLREIFPTGKKEGTSLMWRDSTKVITQRLKTFFKKFGEVNHNAIITATKKYVESFNGDYKYMQVLYYFICKRYIVDGQAEDKSQLLAYIENPEEDINDNWMNDVK